MTQDEIIRMAREAGFVFPETQEDSFTCWWEELERFAALVAAHEREKQAEQEPVAWMQDRNDLYVADQRDKYYTVPLYAAPVRTKDLTDDEIMKINVDTASIVPTCDRQFHFARAVIAADREKNK